MSQSLNRLLRLRKMTEEVCKRELSLEAGKLAAIEHSMDASAGESHSCREDAYSAIGQSRREDWLLATAAQELAEWRFRTLGIELDLQRVCVEESRARFLECRKEKCQLEKLVETGIKAEQMKESRRNQTSLDHWFERRRSLKTPR